MQGAGGQVTAAARRPIRIRFVLISAAMVSLVALIFIPGILGYGSIALLTLPGCTSGADPAVHGLPFEDVSFPSSEFQVDTPAYFIPGADPRNGAMVIVVPTGSAGRGDRIDEIRVYHHAGYDVLSYASRSCLRPVANSLGYREVSQVGDALAYLAGRDADMTRIGLHGFSAGSATAAIAAARYPEIRAVVVEGGYDDFAQYWGENSASMGVLAPFYEGGGRLAYRLTTGDDISVLSPHDAISRIAPRPVLLVYGTHEPSLNGARRTAAENSAHVRLVEIEGATHGSYVYTQPQAYTQAITTFMDAALNGGA